MKRLLALVICITYFIILEAFVIIAMIICIPCCLFQKEPIIFTIIRNMFFKHSIIVMKYFYPQTYQLEKDYTRNIQE